MSIAFRLRDYSYPLPLLKMRRFFEKSQYFSPDEMKAFQLKRLRIILGHASKNIPYYTRLFRETGLDLDKFTEPEYKELMDTGL